jgi:hypothetical protein
MLQQCAPAPLLVALLKHLPRVTLLQFTSDAIVAFVTIVVPMTSSPVMLREEKFENFSLPQKVHFYNVVRRSLHLIVAKQRLVGLGISVYCHSDFESRCCTGDFHGL